MTGSEAICRHVPVLLEEVLEGLAIRQGGVYLDGTIGWGGHTSRILQMYEDTRVIGLDRDAGALDAVSLKLANFGDRVLLSCNLLLTTKVLLIRVTHVRVTG